MTLRLSKSTMLATLLVALLTLSACVVQLPAPATAPAPTAAPAEEAAPERITTAIELTTNPWLWVSFTDPMQQFEVETPENYTISFAPDGTVSVKADCNNATGSYTADDSGSLTIELGAMTLAACPDGSRSDEFVKKLGFVTNFFFEMGILYLDTMADGGTFQLASAPESAADAPQVSVESLMNGSYSGIYDDEPVTLTAGLYEGDEGHHVEYIDNSALFGDINNDGVADAVVVLVENAGGSATNTYIAAQLNVNGQPVDAGAVLVGDRTQIKAASLADGQIVLEIVTQGPEDALCCPTLKVRRSYALVDGLLSEAGSEDLDRLSAADLNGTNWTLTDLGVEGQAILGDPAITLSFADGQISGSGGCNRYTSSFSLEEANPSGIAIEPIAATKMACPEPVRGQETTYFAALDNAIQWGYQVGQLAIYYDVDGQFGTLLFTAEVAP